MIIGQASITGQVTSWIGQYGVYAVFAIMAADAILPVGGELVMLYAGALVAGAVAGAHPSLFGLALHTGIEMFVVLVAAGTLGYLVGSIGGWGLGMWGGRPLLERHGRWVHLGPQRLKRAERWFARFGPWAVLLGRVTPVVRSFISIPAGALGSPLALYVPLTLLGSLAWCCAFAAAGWALGGSYEKVHSAFRYVDYAAVVVVVLVVVLVVVVAVARVVRRRGAGA